MRVTINSKKYPGISLVVPEIPGLEPPQSGNHFFANGVAYDCSQTTVDAIRKQFNDFPDRVSSAYSVQVLDAESPVVGAVDSPPLPPTKTAESAVLEESADPVAEDLAELSDEDLDLIDIEIGKIVGLTVAEAEPILVKTGGNIELPRLLRKTYLEMVMSHEKIQKTLREVAAKLVEQI